MNNRLIELFYGSDLGKCAALMPKCESPEKITRLPVADIQETEKSVIATFELPGVKKEEIELSITEDRVEVKVERKIEKEAKEDDSYAYEMQANSFYGALPLQTEVIAENAEASYKDGMLRVEIPKAKKAEKKRIEVK